MTGASRVYGVRNKQKQKPNRISSKVTTSAQQVLSPGTVVTELPLAVALRDFRDATGILNLDEEIQCCRSLPARRTIRVLTAFVDTGRCSSSNQWSEGGEVKRRCAQGVSRSGNAVDPEGWMAHRPKASGSIIRTGPAVKYPACRDHGSGLSTARNASLPLID
jgi:hypothetical protein